MATAPRPAKSKPPTPRQLRAQRLEAKARFSRTRKAEQGFARHLISVAKQVGNIVTGMAPKGVVKSPSQLHATLYRYGDLIRPWAQAVSARLLSEVDRRDAASWRALSRSMGAELRLETLTTPIGSRMQALLDQQVTLITSLPIKAAERVHKLTIEASIGGQRADEAAKEIMRTGHVTESRAKLIARTETSRTASVLVEARAEHVGSPGYFWRSSGDSDVRPLHKKLNGHYFRWDDPPISGENGERSHPGAIYNCRCYPEPVLPDPDDL